MFSLKQNTLTIAMIAIGLGLGACSKKDSGDKISAEQKAALAEIESYKAQAEEGKKLRDEFHQLVEENRLTSAANNATKKELEQRISGLEVSEKEHNDAVTKFKLDEAASIQAIKEQKGQLTEDQQRVAKEAQDLVEQKKLIEDQKTGIAQDLERLTKVRDAISQLSSGIPGFEQALARLNAGQYYPLIMSVLSDDITQKDMEEKVTPIIMNEVKSDIPPLVKVVTGKARRYDEVSGTYVFSLNSPVALKDLKSKIKSLDADVVIQAFNRVKVITFLTIDYSSGTKVKFLIWESKLIDIGDKFSSMNLTDVTTFAGLPAQCKTISDRCLKNLTKTSEAMKRDVEYEGKELPTREHIRNLLVEERKELRDGKGILSSEIVGLELSHMILVEGPSLADVDNEDVGDYTDLKLDPSYSLVSRGKEDAVFLIAPIEATSFSKTKPSVEGVKDEEQKTELHEEWTQYLISLSQVMKEAISR